MPQTTKTTQRRRANPIPKAQASPLRTTGNSRARSSSTRTQTGSLAILFADRREDEHLSQRDAMVSSAGQQRSFLIERRGRSTRTRCVTRPRQTTRTSRRPAPIRPSSDLNPGARLRRRPAWETGHQARSLPAVVYPYPDVGGFQGPVHDSGQVLAGRVRVHRVLQAAANAETIQSAS